MSDKQKCTCNGCDCPNTATTEDEMGNPVCDECVDFAVDDGGTVHCMRRGDVEVVEEWCGVTPSRRTYVRIKQDRNENKRNGGI